MLVTERLGKFRKFMQSKVLFDQIEGKDLDKDIIQGNIQSRMTKDWREKLEYCYLNNWINKESFETFIEG